MIISAKNMKWFDDVSFVSLIQNNLPILFKKAEIECMRGGKIGMEVGVLRERILISTLIKSFGKNNVEYEFTSTERSKDTQVFNDVLSIKTFMNNGYGGVKIFWASDNGSVQKCLENYTPQNNLLISNIRWGGNDGGLYLIDLKTQNEVFNTIGVKKYLKINGGNNRGVSFQTNVLKTLLSHKNTKKIEINWGDPKINYNVYEKWINEMK